MIRFFSVVLVTETSIVRSSRSLPSRTFSKALDGALQDIIGGQHAVAKERAGSSRSPWRHRTSSHASQQRNLAHLHQVHPHRIVGVVRRTFAVGAQHLVDDRLFIVMILVFLMILVVDHKQLAILDRVWAALPGRLRLLGLGLRWLDKGLRLLRQGAPPADIMGCGTGRYPTYADSAPMPGAAPQRTRKVHETRVF